MWINGKRIWLVGGSEGIGLQVCKQLLVAGAKVVVSSRHAEESFMLQAWQALYPEQLCCLNIDVSQDEDLEEKIHQAWCFFDGLDGWIYNVGLYDPMPVDEWRQESFERMMQANYFGAVRLMMGLQRLQKRDIESSPMRWLWNISLASDYGLPYGGGYSAPKAALMNLAQSLAPELTAFSIELQVVNHGFVKTRLTAKNDFAMLGLMEPEQAATQLLQAWQGHRFETRFPTRLSSILGLLKRLPASWSQAMNRKLLKQSSDESQGRGQA